MWKSNFVVLPLELRLAYNIIVVVEVQKILQMHGMEILRWIV